MEWRAGTTREEAGEAHWRWTGSVKGANNVN
jgi:hypothetical protein